MLRMKAMAPRTTAHAGRILWALRVIVTVNVALFVLQGLTGGEYLVGDEAAKELHAAFAISIHVATGLQTLAAAWLWRVSRAPLWPTLLSGTAFNNSFSVISEELSTPLGPRRR